MMTLTDRTWTQPIIDAVDAAPAITCEHLRGEARTFTLAALPSMRACPSCTAAALTLHQRAQTQRCTRCNLPQPDRIAALRHHGITILCTLCTDCAEVCR